MFAKTVVDFLDVDRRLSERPSGVASENQDDRLLVAVIGKSDVSRAVRSDQIEFRSLFSDFGNIFLTFANEFVPIPWTPYRFPRIGVRFGIEFLSRKGERESAEANQRKDYKMTDHVYRPVRFQVETADVLRGRDSVCEGAITRANSVSKSGDNGERGRRTVPVSRPRIRMAALTGIGLDSRNMARQIGNSVRWRSSAS